MRVSLWWIPADRIRELSASDLAVLRMCRVLTLFMVAVYITVIVSGVGARAERDRLRHQVERCNCAEAP